ncbi:unnamed protein product, partial [marine sediment metagenome]
NYEESHKGDLPSLGDLKKILKISRASISSRLVKVNIKNL